MAFDWRDYEHKEISEKPEWHEYTVRFANGKSMILDIRKDQCERAVAKSTANRWAAQLGTTVVSVKRTK
jgi:hypothetical protein